MPELGRQGDFASCSNHSHGCPRCPHAVKGPATMGSADVKVNGRAALRSGDQGQHEGCCSCCRWTTVGGAPAVFINGRRASRRGDETAHGSNSGVIVNGSHNVVVGDRATRSGPRGEELALHITEFVDPFGQNMVRSRLLVTSKGATTSPVRGRVLGWFEKGASPEIVIDFPEDDDDVE